MKKTALMNLSYGLYTIGTLKYGRKVGCIVNTVFQVTSEPATICVSMNKNNFTHDCIKENGKFSVSILSEETNPAVISSFGFSSSKDKEKYEGFKYEYVSKMPVVMENMCGYLICEVISFVDAGTHSLILAKVVESDVTSDYKPMTYEYYHRVVKGKAPKNAPTYVKEDNSEEKSAPVAKKYYCDVCGYEYDGDITKEPDDYVCPLCKMDKSHFKPVIEEEPAEDLKYYCDVCGYEYVGDITKESDDYVCPLCGMDKSHFHKVEDKKEEKVEEPAEDLKYYCDVCGYEYVGDITKESDDYVSPLCGMDKSHFHKVEDKKEEKVEEPAEDLKYYCDVCGYEYVGDITKEPDDYVCPLCAVDKSHFHKVEDKKEEKVEETASEEVYYCDVCGYEYVGDITKEPDDYVCPLCAVDKSHFIKK